MLPQYEQRFAAAGIATLAFDYRNTGAPTANRGNIFRCERSGRRGAALGYMRTQPEIDRERVGLWGTSLGGMNVLRAAARPETTSRSRSSSVRWSTGPPPSAAWASRRRCGSLRTSSTTRPRAVLRRGRRYVPIVGPPAARRWSRSPGAEAGLELHRAPRRHASRTASRRPTPRPRRRRQPFGTPEEIAAPLLVCVCDRETLIDPKYVELTARAGASRRRTALRLRPFRDLSSAAGRAGARRPDRLPQGASRCPCVIC